MNNKIHFEPLKIPKAVKKQYNLLSEDNIHCDPVKMNVHANNRTVFSLLTFFSKAARKQGRTEDEISLVIKDCMEGDYMHSLRVLMNHTK
jgi:hypothetical protein